MKAKRLLAKFVGENPGCSDNDCPAIIEAEDGNFMVIGKKPTGNEDLQSFACIADDELLVILPREVIIKTVEQLTCNI
ncbi:MAG: hypothetical protein ABIN91_01595 [Mucilaginibacter sp.]|uniref:hypothetical protein n=1 Tax=Mucilaginibacter sp. TaxID=1882438 RepID=UPI0032634867